MRLKLIILCCLFLIQNAYSQHWSFSKNNNVVKVPFELINHVIIIPVNLNGENLSFLLDTGVKETLLFGSIDSLTLNNVSAVTFQGLGESKSIEGLLSTNNRLSLADSSLVDYHHNLYVIVDSATNLSNSVGVPVHGILGSNFFVNNIVHIDYLKRMITVSRTLEVHGKKLMKYKSLPLNIHNNRPYIQVDLTGFDAKYSNAQMLIDLGNSDPSMIFSHQLPQHIIREPFIYEFLGKGFNGDIHGKRSLLKSIQIADFSVERPIVSYPDSISYSRGKLVKDRIGSIGSQIMGRFDVIFDYRDSTVYLRKNKKFKAPFHVDMSGLDIRHDGFVFVKTPVVVSDVNNVEGGVKLDFATKVNYKIELVPSFVIYHVREGSAAFLAGIKAGDILKRVNGRMAGKLSLDKIKESLQTQDKDIVTLEIFRGEDNLKFRFKLIDPLAIN